MAWSPQQSDDSSDEGSLHIDTDTKPARNAKVKKEGVGSAAGILDLLQASEEVGALEYNPNRYGGGLGHSQGGCGCLRRLAHRGSLGPRPE